MPASLPAVLSTTTRGEWNTWNTWNHFSLTFPSESLMKKSSRKSVPSVPTLPKKQITADYLRRHWVFQPPTPSELAEVERLEREEQQNRNRKP
jgi:hypothetical protein